MSWERWSSWSGPRATRDRIARGLVEKMLADAGYWSQANVEALEKKGIETLVAPERRKHSDPLPPAPRGRPPKKITLKERMKRKLQTSERTGSVAKRQILPEPFFGQIKQARSFRQFLRRGLEAVGEEWALVGTAHNLLKLYGARA